ncbi:DoxX family protein [Candidatus Parcubacteria bacterium]|nr:MAG: DoxX family protein [Candidatus Parcubacteria bacterium]
MEVLNTFFLSVNAYEDWALLFLRLVIAVIFAAHAVPKLKQPRKIAQMMGGPAAMPVGLGTVEMVAALALVLGIAVPLAALVLGIVMLGAIYFKMVKWHIPFAAMDKSGWEFDLILFAGNVVLLATGGGNFTLL